MSLSKQLRAERLRLLHAKFLDASEKHTSLYHVACRSDQERLWAAMLPEPDSVDDADYDDFWCHALDYNQYDAHCRGVFASPGQLTIIGTEEWIGRYTDPEHRTLAANEGHGYIPLFLELSREAVANLATPEMLPAAAITDAENDVCGRNHWLDFLYHVFAGTTETMSYHPNFPFPMKPGESFLVTGLPWNVFLTSARTVEFLIEKGFMRLDVTNIAGNPMLSFPGGELAPSTNANRRPAYERDHLWLDWNINEGLKPAPIRDRWDGMSDESRKAACRQAWEKIGDGGKEAGRDVVKKALKKAEEERKDEASARND